MLTTGNRPTRARANQRTRVNNVARRQNYQLTNFQTLLPIHIDGWRPSSLSIVNPTEFPVYVNIGSSSPPSALGATDIIAPFSSYNSDPAGARDFCIQVDNTSDPIQPFTYPVQIVVSQGGGSAQQALAVGFPPVSPNSGYIPKVLGVQPGQLIGLWSLADFTGTKAVNSVPVSSTYPSRVNDGLYKPVDVPFPLQQIPFADNFHNAPRSNLIYNYEVDIFNSNNANLWGGNFSGQKGTILVWINFLAATLNGGGPGGIIRLSHDGNNLIQIALTAPNNIQFFYDAGGTVNTFNFNAPGVTYGGKWVALGMTFDHGANQMIPYVNGVPQTTQTPLGLFVDNVNTATLYEVGGANFSPDSIAMCSIWNTALTGTQMSTVSTAP